MDPSLMARLRELEAENTKLKKIYAEERLKAEIIQEVMPKVVKPSCRCQMAQQAISHHCVILVWLSLLLV